MPNSSGWSSPYSSPTFRLPEGGNPTSAHIGEWISYCSNYIYYHSYYKMHNAIISINNMVTRYTFQLLWFKRLVSIPSHGTSLYYILAPGQHHLAKKAQLTCKVATQALYHYICPTWTCPLNDLHGSPIHKSSKSSTYHNLNPEVHNLTSKKGPLIQDRHLVSASSPESMVSFTYWISFTYSS